MIILQEESFILGVVSLLLFTTCFVLMGRSATSFHMEEEPGRFFFTSRVLWIASQILLSISVALFRDERELIPHDAASATVKALRHRETTWNQVALVCVIGTAMILTTLIWTIPNPYNFMLYGVGWIILAVAAGSSSQSMQHLSWVKLVLTLASTLGVLASEWFCWSPITFGWCFTIFIIGNSLVVE